MTFQPGVSGNPNGKPTGSGDFIARLHHWTKTHDIEEIEKIYKNKAKFNKLPVIDGLCCVRLYEAIQQRGGQTMENLFDRLIGKPTQHTTLDARVLAQVQVTHSERKLEATREAEVMLDVISGKVVLPIQTAIREELLPPLIEQVANPTESISSVQSETKPEATASAKEQPIVIE